MSLVSTRRKTSWGENPLNRLRGTAFAGYNSFVVTAARRLAPRECPHGRTTNHHTTPGTSLVKRSCAGFWPRELLQNLFAPRGFVYPCPVCPVKCEAHCSGIASGTAPWCEGLYFRLVSGGRLFDMDACARRRMRSGLDGDQRGLKGHSGPASITTFAPMVRETALVQVQLHPFSNFTFSTRGPEQGGQAMVRS